MTCATLLAALTALVSSSSITAVVHPAPADTSRRPVRTIGATSIVGDADPALWRGVLDVLPVRPARIVILDVDALSLAAQEKVRGLEAFVIEGGDATIYVVRQARTLRQAETGDAFDRLTLASVILHELSHARGLDEPAALGAEQTLWRRLVAAGRVESALGMAYVQTLEDQRRKHLRARDAGGTATAVRTPPCRR